MTKTAGLIAALAALTLAGCSDSLQEHQDKAVDACKSAIDEKAPTQWRKLWQDDTMSATGADPITVTGKFSTKDTGFRSFTCTVQDGKVTDVQVSP